MKSKKKNSGFTIIISVLILGILALAIILFTMYMHKDLVPQVILEKESVSLLKNNNIKINGYVLNYPDATLIWESSDDSIAKVNDGIVTGVNYGTAIITAKYTHSDGEIYKSVCFVKIYDGSEGVPLASISFPKGDLIIPINKEYDLLSQITINPVNGYIENKVINSLDNNIVQVNQDGKVSCLKDGESVVEANFNNGVKDSIKVLCNNTVNEPEIVINPEKIVLSDIEIEVGDTGKIQVELAPNNVNAKYLELISLNPDIVSIDDTGNIKGLKEGKATIKVSSINGITSTCVVSVNKKIIKATSISITDESVELYTGESYTITPTVFPKEATNQELTFTSSNGIVSIVPSEDKKSAVITANSGGNDVIIITNADGVTKQLLVTVKSFVIVNPTIKSTGTINSSLMGSGSVEGFESCRTHSPNLTLKINGRTIGQDGSVSIGVGQAFNVEVYLPTMCGSIVTLTRTSPDGSTNWEKYVRQVDKPFVDRYNESTFLSGVTHYTWTIMGIKAGSVILSQTAQFDVRISGRSGNIKSMIRLNVRVKE